MMIKIVAVFLLVAACYASEKYVKLVSASQSNTGWNGVASRAIDGNTNGDYHANSCTHTSAGQKNWWTANFLSMYAVSKVIIYARQDCCTERTNDAEIYVGEVYCGKVVYKEGKTEYTVECGGIIGASVKIRQHHQYLSLCEVKVIQASEKTVKLVSASQSNIGWYGVASRAIDGNTNGDYRKQSCSHTSADQKNWWTANFDSTSAVGQVIIYPRMDCCTERINGAKIYVGEVYCGEVVYEAGKIEYTVECGGIIGDSVKITQHHQYLSLCEVMVIQAAEKTVKLVSASQSNTGWNGVASRAIDGNTNGDYREQSCSSTSTDQKSWWTAKFDSTSAVSQVIIYNRLDCCSDRINGAKIYVGEVYCGEVVYEEGKTEYTVECGGIIGDSVKITQYDQYLTLCEVMVIQGQDE